MRKEKDELMTQYVKNSCEEIKLVPSWGVENVLNWAKTEPCSRNIITCLENEAIDGQVLLALNESDIRDFRFRLNYKLTFGELKKLWLSVRALQSLYAHSAENGRENSLLLCSLSPLLRQPDTTPIHHIGCRGTADMSNCSPLENASTLNYAPYKSGEFDNSSSAVSIDGRASNIAPEFFKTFISLGYSFLVTWITSFVMVIVHERVPDMKRYPPLPDIFLDNVPHIPWAFQMCEITGTLLFTIWTIVCVFHKYRMVLLRRFFALAGTVFLLRCVTMLITSLSVPGTHLQCNQSDYAVDDAELTIAESLELRISRAYIIWSGLGMSIQGVRTCGDYMFSGHTVALTLLNFFITEYTPRNLYFLHTLSWLLNMFGIFFILAAHEHYSIDVFVAFYITSRLFLYYHTLANNQALMSRDSNRTRIWFPMFSYFENSVDGIIPNEYDTVGGLFHDIWHCIFALKDYCSVTVKRLLLDAPQITRTTKMLLTSDTDSSFQTNALTPTSAVPSSTPIMKESSCTYDKPDPQKHKRTLESNNDLSSFANDTIAVEAPQQTATDKITKKDL